MGNGDEKVEIGESGRGDIVERTKTGRNLGGRKAKAIFPPKNHFSMVGYDTGLRGEADWNDMSQGTYEKLNRNGNIREKAQVILSPESSRLLGCYGVGPQVRGVKEKVNEKPEKRSRRGDTQKNPEVEMKKFSNAPGKRRGGRGKKTERVTGRPTKKSTEKKKKR